MLAIKQSVKYEDSQHFASHNLETVGTASYQIATVGYFINFSNTFYSDARLFCKNKQANLKNKPKMGNLAEKQAQHAIGKKIQKNINTAG